MGRPRISPADTATSALESGAPIPTRARGFYLLNKLAKTLKERLAFRRVIGLYRRRLSRSIFADLDGVVRYGPFAGMRWLDNPSWGRSEQGVMMLGLYEQEVITALVDSPARFRVFVDVGAADGYYAVGMLQSGRVDRSVAYEAIPAGREAIKRLATENGVAEKITILGTATERFENDLASQQIKSDETLFLFDIEGAEFKILTGELFAFLKNSLIVVELHPNIYPDPAGEVERLIQRASATHTVATWFPGARNPWTIRELDRFPEIDRWILCSEGRLERQQWLRFDPHDSAASEPVHSL